MGDCFLHRSGGSGGEVHSAISTTYPAGSVCTASDGKNTITAPDTSGAVIFNVEPGFWIVKAEDAAGKSKTASVTVTDVGEVHEVELKFSLVLFDNGVDNTDITGGWSSIVNGRVSVSATTYSAGVGETSNTATTSSKNAIDLSDYSILRFYDLQTTYEVQMGVDGSSIRKRYEDSGSDVEIDISSINSAKSIWIRITAYSNNGANTETASVAKIELI